MNARTHRTGFAGVNDNHAQAAARLNHDGFRAAHRVTHTEDQCDKREETECCFHKIKRGAIRGRRSRSAMVFQFRSSPGAAFSAAFPAAVRAWPLFSLSL